MQEALITARHTRTRLLRLAALSACVLSFTAPAFAETELFVGNGGGDYGVKVKTFADRRFTGVIHQKYDFSCGSAALATVLSYHYGHKVDEMDVLNAMYAQGDQEKIRREGFSLLDMKQYLGSIGYHAEGYRESLNKLQNVAIPAIVLLNKRGYLHFVVIKGVDDDKVSVGDPTLGISIYSRKEFEKMWNGVLFVIVDRMNTGRASFNTAAAWRPYGVPSFRNMLDMGELSSMTLNTVYSPNFF